MNQTHVRPRRFLSRHRGDAARSAFLAQEYEGALPSLRKGRRLGGYALLLGALVALVTFFVPSGPTTAGAATTPTAFTVPGLDLHDGQLEQFGSTYYLYGTEYGCGFTWRSNNTPWCGFGVATSADLVHWSSVTTIVSPFDADPFAGETWNQECGGSSTQIAAGCFNPRMIQRSGWGLNDGTFILWFNSPEDWARNQSNAYDVMGCNGPLGPCGQGYAPHGSTHKPSLNFCTGNGDFTVVPQPSAAPEIICTRSDQTLAEEPLSQWGTDGNGGGSANLAGLTNVEAPGAYFDATKNQWVMTYSDPDCGYCQGTATAYATSSSLAGPWSAPTNSGVAAPPGARRDITATSCGGQPRTISVVNGTAYEGVDLWVGSLNESPSPVAFIPLVRTSDDGGPGTPWQPFRWDCP
jgi:hypothetical protein